MIETKAVGPSARGSGMTVELLDLGEGDVHLRPALGAQLV
jgi:hypothetical protein